MAQIDAEPKTCTRKQVSDLIARLMRNYPAFKPSENVNFTVALGELFESYPWSVGYRATGHDGIISQEIFGPFPKTSDCKKGLEAELQRRDLIRANALWHMQEADNRAKQRQAEAEFNAKYPNAETRRRQVAELLGARQL